MKKFSALECFSEDGVLSKALESYEFRPQQLDIALAVEDAIKADKILIAEAGPGVGKSFAYLVPFIVWAVSNERKVVISTYTKALQNQLFVKDLPLLREVLGIDVEYALCMGSENYLCLKRSASFDGGDLFGSGDGNKGIRRIMDWAGRTVTGLLTDMDFIPDGRIWEKLRREPDLCSGRRCRHFENCFFMRARKQQAASHILISNHALLFTALKGSGGILPDFQALVIDEAHTVEDVATSHFGVEFSSWGVEKLTSRVEDLASAGKLEAAKTGKAGETLEILRKRVGELRRVSGEFFDKACSRLPRKEVASEFDPRDMGCGSINDALKELSGALSLFSSETADEDLIEMSGAYAERADKMNENVSVIFRERPPGYVFWARVRETKGGANVAFNGSPVDVSAHMRENVFEKLSPVVLTSATLSASSRKGDLAFLKKRLGIGDPLEISVDSPYMYDKKVLLYVPEGIRDPASDKSAFKDDLVRHITEIYDAMGGRIFALFTSYEMLWAVSADISGSRPDIYLLKQGDMPRYVLLDVFKNNRKGMLMGTTTFWQGVDVPGSSLECVIVTRLPFGVPTDPVNSARIRNIRQSGGNAFTEYQMPQALIMFKQGFGRLIRSHSDRGVFAVLDPRIRTRRYGNDFLKYIPQCEVTEVIQDVRSFFTEHQAMG